MATHEDPRELVELARAYYVSGFGRGPEFFNKPGSIVASVHGNHFTDIFGRQLFDTESLFRILIQARDPDSMARVSLPVASTQAVMPFMTPLLWVAAR